VTGTVIPASRAAASDRRLTIRSASDLAVVAEGRERFDRIAVNVAGLEPGSRAAFESRINRDYRACGCEISAAATVAAMVGYVAYVVLRDVAVRDHVIRVVALGFAVVIVAAVVGKVAGRLIARRRLRRTLAALERHMRGRETATSV
jgi:hypothetical protein